MIYFVVFTKEHQTCGYTKDIDAAIHFMERLREMGVEAYVEDVYEKEKQEFN